MALMAQFCACCRITVPQVRAPRARVHVERRAAAQQTEQELSSKRHPIPHLFLCGIYAFHYIFCARAWQERFPFPPHARVQSSPARYAPGRGCSTCQRSLAEFALAGANRVLIIFSGDMCVGENTLRLANVQAKRVRCGEPQPFQPRAQRSGSRLRACQKAFFDKLKGRRSNGTAALFAWGDREDWEKGKRHVNFRRLPEYGRLPSRQIHGRTQGRGRPFRFR